MNMFLKTSSRLINLKNVSSINIVKEKFRIIFNLNYSIHIQTGTGSKHISDYVYWDGISASDLESNIEHVEKNIFFKLNFLSKINNGWVNINQISSLKFSEKKNRVIFNLSHPVSFKDMENNTRATSEFVYVDCQNSEKFKQYVEYVNQIIGEK
jgi:hypothetical protein